jgi:hypothetical protein
MKTGAFVALVLLTIAGCSSMPATNHFAVNTADFTTASDINLCSVYGYGWNRAEEAKQELVHRNFFTTEELQNIKQRQIKPGMTLCAVYAAYTNSCAKYAVTKDAQGNEIKELIYDCSEGRVPFCPFTQVMLKNDKVIEVKDVKSL